MERNYSEDQKNEVEALESIYWGQLEIVEKEPYYKFRIPIATEEYQDDSEENGLACKLMVSYGGKYPDEAPMICVEDPVGFDDDNLEDRLLEHINEIIEENIGTEMIFTLVSSAQEWLNLRWDDIKREREEAEERRKIEREEAERKKFEGTRVTVESFLKWRNEFELETGITAKKEKAALEAKKLTGKELFLRDNTLNESDIKFLLEAGESIESVKIDESLFQNIEDLDLDDSDDDDPDFVPT